MSRIGNAKLGDFIRSAREAKQLSLRQLGHASGVDYSTIARLEQGQFASPDPIKLSKIAAQLELSTEDIYEMAGFPMPAAAGAPAYNGIFPASSIPSVRPSAEAAEAVLSAINKSIEKDVKGPGLQTLWRLDLAEELLSSHLATLQTDFAKLLGGEKLNDVNTHRRDMLMSVFYGLQDTYVGVDSHLPRDFFSAYPSLLEHLRPTTGFELVNEWGHQCYAPQATRILPISQKVLKKDYAANKPVWETYLRKHKENGIRLLQVDPQIAKQALNDYVPGLGWTTEIGIWVRTCAMLFEEPGLSEERTLQLLCPGEALWRDYIQYVKHLVHNTQSVGLQHGKLVFDYIDELDKEDILWSLEALYESPPLAQAWSRFVDPPKRLRQGEAAFLDKLIAAQQQKLGREKLKVFDACMGVGAEVVWLRTNHARDCDVLSNEIEWTLAAQAVDYAKSKGLDLSFTMFDWRHLDAKLARLRGTFDIIMILGNSLSCFGSTEDMKRVLTNFKELLAPGGILVLDERNYRKFYDPERWSPNDFVPPEVVYTGNVRARPNRDHMGEPGKDFMYLEYFAKQHGADQHLGYFRVYPFAEGQIRQLLAHSGFGPVKQYDDYEAKPDEDAWFITYVAEKPQ